MPGLKTPRHLTFATTVRLAGTDFAIAAAYTRCVITCPEVRNHVAAFEPIAKPLAAFEAGVAVLSQRSARRLRGNGSRRKTKINHCESKQDSQEPGRSTELLRTNTTLPVLESEPASTHWALLVRSSSAFALLSEQLLSPAARKK
jgi:hypothetical protein